VPILGHFTIISFPFLYHFWLSKDHCFIRYTPVKVVLFDIILEGLAASVYRHNTGCFTCNAVNIIF